MSVFKRKSRERFSCQHHVLFFLLIIAANEHLIDPVNDIWHCAVFSEVGGRRRRDGGHTAVNLLTGISVAQSELRKQASYLLHLCVTCLRPMKVSDTKA